METKIGTPISLQDAINRALYMTPATNGVTFFHQIIRDYLSQHFGTAYFVAESPEEIKRLQALWSLITGEPNGGAQ
jgi:hypothetical protein